jgi:hypothetical protein
MKALQLIQEIPYNSIKKISENFHHLEIRNSLPFKFGQQIFDLKQTIANTFGGQITFKSASTYLFNASIEGLKQNFLRPDIDMEFFILSLKVYSILLIKLAISNPSIISLKFIE